MQRFRVLGALHLCYRCVDRENIINVPGPVAHFEVIVSHGI
jgi:hypothetical protein